MAKDEIKIGKGIQCPAQQFVLDKTSGPDCFGLTDEKGVYLVCVAKFARPGSRKLREVVAYVGSSKNIKKRVAARDHPYWVLYEMCQWPTLVYVRTFACENYLEREVQFIRLFRPPLNRTHNG